MIQSKSSELISKVLNRELDGAFIAGDARHPDLVYCNFRRETLLLAAAQSNPITSWQGIFSHDMIAKDILQLNKLKDVFLCLLQQCEIQYSTFS